MTENTTKTPNQGTGLDSNTASALTYVLGPISGVIFLIIEKNPRVRFHAMQSIIVLGGLTVVEMLLGATILLSFLIPLLWVFGFVLWLVLIYKAWQGEDWEVPVLGQYARKFLKKV